MQASTLYIIIAPTWLRSEASPRSWKVMRRNEHRQVEIVADVTSHESAVAMLPEGFVHQGTFFDLEFWEPVKS